MKKNWPKIKRTSKNGKTAFLVDARIAGDNGGGRRFFGTREEAETYAQSQRIRRQNEGASAVSDVELAAYGWTVRQAIEFALKHLRDQSKSKPLSEAVSMFLADKAEAGHGKRYLYDLKLRMGRFVKSCGDIHLASINTAQINDYLQKLVAHPSTRNTHRRDLHTFFQWSKNLDLVTQNPVERARSYRVKTAPVATIDPDQFSRLLRACHDEIVPHVVLAGFCGVRDSELKRLKWEAVDLKQRIVVIDSSVAKTNSRRSVLIPKAAVAWLKIHRKEKGDILKNPGKFRVRWDTARLQAGFGPFLTGTAKVKAVKNALTEEERGALIPWPSNGLRHSAISYRLALQPGDVALAFDVPRDASYSLTSLEVVADQSGNSSSVIKKHYLKLVKPEDAKRWFSVLP